MSPEDGVRDLVLRHADFLNLAQLQNFAENFTTDGIWEITGVASPQGRAAIHKTVEDLTSRFDWILQGVYGTRIISLEAGLAKARSYITEYGWLRGESYFLIGCYHDHCEFVDEKWFFKHRIFHVLYRGSAALNAAMTTFPAPDLF